MNRVVLCISIGFLPDGVFGVHPEGGKARGGEQQDLQPEPVRAFHLPVLQGRAHEGHALRGHPLRK